MTILEDKIKCPKGFTKIEWAMAANSLNNSTSAQWKIVDKLDRESVVITKKNHIITLSNFIDVYPDGTTFLTGTDTPVGIAF